MFVIGSEVTHDTEPGTIECKFCGDYQVICSGAVSG